MYGDWFIQHGERVRSANSPLVPELCTQHRLDYAGHKNKYKCTHLGCWRKGVLTPTGEGLECTIHAELRVGWSVPATDKIPSSASRTTAPRHPATKSVQIRNAESDSQGSCDSIHSSDPELSRRRESTDSMYTGDKRLSTGSEHTPAASDRSVKFAPSVLLAPTTSAMSSTPATRQKAYHFDDEYVGRPSSTCDDLVSGHADMAQTAPNLVSHGPPTRRRSVVTHQPPKLAPVVQNVNTLTTPCFAPPHAYPGAVRGVVVGAQDDSHLVSAPALVVGSASNRASYLTHVIPPGGFPHGGVGILLSGFPA